MNVLSSITIKMSSTSQIIFTGKLFANDIPIVEIHESDNSVIFVMEKILWIRPEDIECGIVRLVEK